ncbi:hypothetical protein RZO85_28715 [Raoultella ornithinolytica]|uniref:hypothetical protein n=1 Tax=Raoultella ornithinolytica TaxID=54291 RepID=UPI00292BF102|nr:hypothetical protein [Raoultella ornithinolytica]MDV0603629.1 hypothetical protein [Raoultella ornithinolytica]HCI5670929.1 hypothetical protein [Klebsiella quasipneumoniae subsp. similipneumoniae]
MAGNTKEDFMAFVNDYESITGASSRTAENVRGVCLLVLPTISDEEDVTSWSVNEIIDRYAEQNNITGDSKRSYLSRFKSAVSKFVAYQNGEDVKMTSKRQRTTAKPKVNDESAAFKTFELPIPLRGDLIVSIGNLPRDLTKEEAKRISTIVESFAVPDDLI